MVELDIDQTLTMVHHLSSIPVCISVSNMSYSLQKSPSSEQEQTAVALDVVRRQGTLSHEVPRTEAHQDGMDRSAQASLEAWV